MEESAMEEGAMEEGAMESVEDVEAMCCSGRILRLGLGRW